MIVQLVLAMIDNQRIAWTEGNENRSMQFQTNDIHNRIMLGFPECLVVQSDTAVLKNAMLEHAIRHGKGWTG